VYASQWVPWGNLRAATGTSSGQFHLVRRGAVPSVQQPSGTRLADARARLSEPGCTSFFNVGSSSSTFHHQYADGQTGALVEDGPQLAANYAIVVPGTAPISRPFSLASDGDGDVGPEFSFTAEYPRFTAQLVRRFYNHAGGTTGSGLVRLREPSGARGGYVVVNGLDRTTESGSPFIARYSLVSLIHSIFAAGVPGSQNRIKQLPRISIVSPTVTTELEDPETITLQWKTEWRRWDGRPYTSSYPSNFTENVADVVYVPMYSTDGGTSWLSLMNDAPATPGVVPYAGGVPDPARTLRDRSSGDETYEWSTPATRIPRGYYHIRVDAYRASERLHYSQHIEKIYVDR
jgi:hypothetical protein